MNRCKHGLELSRCGYCNGTVPIETDRVTRVSPNNPRNLFNKIKRLQKQSLSFATNYGDKYTDKEVKFLIDNTKDVKRTDLNKLFDIAKTMKRSFNGIDFMWKNLWDKNFPGYQSYNIEKIEKLKKETI